MLGLKMPAFQFSRPTLEAVTAALQTFPGHFPRLSSFITAFPFAFFFRLSHFMAVVLNL